MDIVLGAETCAQVPEFATIELDLIQVKGKTIGVNIFALLGDENMEKTSKFRGLKEEHQKMISSYRAQEWDRAKVKLRNCQALSESFGLKQLYNLYENRITEYEAKPPAPNWDGVFIALDK